MILVGPVWTADTPVGGVAAGESDIFCHMMTGILGGLCFVTLLVCKGYQ